MYTKLAKYYDLIYSWKNYDKESEKIIKLIRKYKKSKGNRLLEVACGTGEHIKHLQKHYKITGLDLNQPMLNIAKKKFKDIPFYCRDMKNFNLKGNFDVILSLFSSIGYLKTYQNFKKTIENFCKHLVAGGVVIIEPWLNEASFISDLISIGTHENEKTKMTIMTISKKKGHISVLDMHYLIAENQQIKHYNEHHELAMFAREKMIKIMEQSGLKTIFIKNGLMEHRGLLVGVKT